MKNTKYRKKIKEQNLSKQNRVKYVWAFKVIWGPFSRLLDPGAFCSLTIKRQFLKFISLKSFWGQYILVEFID